MKPRAHVLLAMMTGLLLGAAPTRAGSLAFVQTYVDLNYGGNGKPGWVRAGDMDNDGDLDLVAGGGQALFVYENNGSAGAWPRHGSLDSTGQMGSNGAVLYDVNNDGALDVVAARYNGDLGWWQNPGGPLQTAPWTFHRLAGGLDGWYLHDLIHGDLDRDGRAEEFVAVLQRGYWDAPFHVLWFRPGANPYADWNRYVITQNQAGPNNNHSGVDLGDIDGDGDIDVAFSNGWFESPGNPMGVWTWHPVTNLYGVSNTLIRDIDGDGDADLVMSAGHHGQGVYWLENTGGPTWPRHNIDAVAGNPTTRHSYAHPENGSTHLHHPEGLQVADLDGDGDLDVLASELFFGEDPGEPGWSEPRHNLYVFENLGGTPPGWLKRNIAPGSYPSHLPSLVDVNRDGRLDIITESAGYGVISYYRSITGRAPGLPELVLGLNQSSFWPGETMILSATLSPGTTPIPVDAYVVARAPGGELISLLADGRVVLGIAPIVTGIVPVPFTGEIFRYTFSGSEPIGDYAWLAALAQAGTSTLIGNIDEDPFLVGP